VVSPVQQPIPITTIPRGSVGDIISGIIALGAGTSGTLQPIRATVYTEQTVGAQRSFTSSSASDASGGVGAQQVELTYFTSDGRGPFIETVPLNGVTAVPTVATDICFIEKMTVTRVGATGTNVGTITLFVNNAGGGGTIGTIGVGNIITAVGDNQTFWAHHYVPTGKICWISTFTTAIVSGASVAKFLLRAQSILKSGAPDLYVWDLLQGSPSFVVNLGFPLKVPGFSRLTMYVVPGSANSTQAGSFNIVDDG
jgi:hypothetical protein